MLFDTHTHLNDEYFTDDLPAFLDRARRAGVELMNIIGFDVPSSKLAVEQARDREGIYAVIGIHPHDADSWNREAEAEFRRLLAADEAGKIVAIGEIGLDYHFDDSLPKPVQKQAFREQMLLACEFDLPFVVHDRDAHQDCLEVIEEVAAEGKLRAEPGVFHCYSGSLEFAQRLLALGFYLGFDGPVTFKNGKKPLAVASAIPLERLLLETDCPYLAPEPYRGRRNEPAYLPYIAERLAEARGLSTDELAAATTANALRLFKPEPAN